jgi:PAS domain S-box-containing protein
VKEYHMKKEPTSTIEFFAEDYPSLLQRSNDATETIDLNSLFTKDITETGSFEIRSDIWTSTFGKVVQSLPLPALLIDQSHNVMAANQACRKISLSYEDLIGEPFSSIFATESDISHSEFLVSKVFSTRKLSAWEAAVKSDQGNLWGRLTFRSISIGGQRSLLALIEDVSLEKRYKEELERNVAERTEALEQSHNQVLSLFESINEVILVIDPVSYEILYANKFTEDLYGKKLIGGICYEKFQGFDAPCHNCLNETIMSLQGQPYRWEYRNPTLGKDFIATDKMIRWPDGRQVKFQFAVDITERNEAEQEQEHLKAQLFQSQKLESIGTLAGGIAHDFNNLLTVILGYSEVLQLVNKDTQDQAYKGLKRIHQAAKNGADLVKRILAFSKKTDSQPRPLDLNYEIRQAKKMLDRMLQRIVTVELRLSNEPALANADPIQVEQVLINLAVNARDAMPKGGTLVVETKTVMLDQEYCKFNLDIEPGRYVVVSVSDTGHGMDEETIKHIFEPFYTTKELGKGTGLGLAMVYGIIKQHGGQVTCYSEIGVGTTFKIYLPAVQSEIKVETPAETTDLASGVETILLVDDEDAVRELAKELLELFGYTVLTAYDGKNALDVYKKNRKNISLVILDLMMPKMSGSECLEELLKIDPDIKVIIASGYCADPDNKNNVGAKGFIDKPYHVKGLLDTIREVLDSK